MAKISYKVTLGTVWQHSNGIYYARWQDRGRNRRKSLGTKDPNVAMRRFRKFRRDLIAGRITPIEGAEKISLFDFVDELLDYIENSNKAGSTYTLYKVALDKAKKCWGDTPLNHIGTKQIDLLVKDMNRANLSLPTINKNLRHVKASLRKAKNWKYIKHHVEFPPFDTEEDEVRFLTKDALKALMKVIDDLEFADFCMLSAYTGLRSGELLRLSPIEIDNPEGFLRISTKQKNKKEARIPINSHARAIINRCLKRRKGAPTLFRFHTITWVSQKFKKYAREAGLKDARFHDLRHTFGSHLVMSGKHLKVIQELMRHKDISSTMVYAKVSPEYLKDASEDLNYGPMPVGKKQEQKK